MYKRILLKLSGESLMGEQGYGIDRTRLQQYAEQIKEMAETGLENRHRDWRRKYLPRFERCAERL